MQNPIQINDGEFQISDEPGFGVNWDWNAIKKFSEN
jgi:L-alanine-DL-glutamate epimerase-like enolase superfamily enzyme